MARTGITYKQVAEAAGSITRRGEEPTLKALRDELGGEGSFTTISKYLKQWNTEQSDKEPDPELPPADVQNAFMEAAMTAWHTSTRTYNVNLAAMKHQHERELKKHIEDNEEMLKALGKLEKELDETRAALAEKEASYQLVSVAEAQAKTELETTKQLYAALVASLGSKQPSASGKKAGDTKAARPSSSTTAPVEKQP